MIDKFLTKDNIIIVVVAVVFVLGFLWQSNYFATRLEVSQLKAEVLQMKIDLMSYSDKGDKEIMDKLDTKYEKILQKLDHIQR